MASRAKTPPKGKGKAKPAVKRQKPKTAAGAIPRKKKTPAHIKAAAERAIARSEGRDPLEGIEVPPHMAAPEEGGHVRVGPIRLGPPGEPPPPPPPGGGDGEGRGRGRPPKYDPAFALVAKGMCKLGATDHELAVEFNVDTATIWAWQSKYEDFSKALQLGKERPDDRVERSLYQRAVGYSYNAVKIMQHMGVPVVTEYVEHVPPDPGAAKLWLSNRRPKEWREKVEAEIGVTDAVAQLLTLVDGSGRGLPGKD